MIASPLLAFGLSLALAVPPSAVPAPGAKEPADAPVESSIVVTVTSNLGIDDGGEVEHMVRTAVLDGLRARGFSPEARGATRLSVRIDWIDEGRDGYTLHYAAKQVRQSEHERTSPCRRCGSDELAALIDADLDALRPELTPEPAPPALPAVTAVPPPPVQARKIGPMGITGAVLLGTGLATVLPGVVLAALGDASRVDPENSQYLQVTPRRTPGLVLVGVGAAVMIAGAILLGVDLKRRRTKSTTKARVGITRLGLVVRW